MELKTKKNQVADIGQQKQNQIDPIEETEMAPQPTIKVAQRVNTIDDQRALLNEKIRKANMNKVRLKGPRNRNNPWNEIRKAQEVIIVKQANYTDCLTCQFYIQDNAYKVYTEDEFYNELINVDDDDPTREEPYNERMAKLEDEIVANQQEQNIPGQQDIQPDDNDYQTRKDDEFEGGDSDSHLSRTTKKSKVSFLKDQGHQVKYLDLSSNDNVSTQNRSEFQYQGGQELDTVTRMPEGQIQEEDEENDETLDFYPQDKVVNFKKLDDDEFDFEKLGDLLNIEETKNEKENIKPEVDEELKKTLQQTIAQQMIRKIVDLKVQQMMQSKVQVPKSLVNKRLRILKIEQDSMMAQRFYLPADIRPYDAYALSSNGTFEFSRMERPWKIIFPLINVFKTQFKYTTINDHFTETFIGKIEQSIGIGRTIKIYEATDTDLILKYELKGSLLDRVKEFICPRMKCSIFKQSTYKIVDVYKLAQLKKQKEKEKEIQDLLQKTLKQRLERSQKAIKSNPSEIELKQDDETTKLKVKDEPQINLQIPKPKEEVKATTTTTQVEDADEGLLTREYSYFAKECFSRGGHYRMKFPRAATVNQKTLLINAVMMLDMNYYDRKCCCPIFPC